VVSDPLFGCFEVFGNVFNVQSGHGDPRYPCAPILKDAVERNQFTRDRGGVYLVEAGIAPEHAEAFLTHLDGLAAAQGMDLPTWYLKHIADIEVGGVAGADDIRFQAAMYRNKAQSVDEYINEVRANRGGKESYLTITELNGSEVRLPSFIVNHLDNKRRHLTRKLLNGLNTLIADYDEVLPGNPRKVRMNGDPFVIVKYDGRKVVAAVVEKMTKKDGDVYYVTTSFEGSQGGFSDWAKERTGEARSGTGGTPSIDPSPDKQGRHRNIASDKNIHHQNTVRKAVERLQGMSKNALPFKVVATFDDLPDHVRALAAERGIDSVRGVNDGRHVYMVADAIETEGQAVALWLHEQGVHNGLRGLVGDAGKFDTLMDSVFDHFGPERLYDIRQAYGLDFSNATHRREAAEEMLARIGEKVLGGGDLSELEVSAWESIKAWFRELLRGHGIEVEMTDEEIAGIVRDAVRWTMYGDPGVSRLGPQRFKVDGGTNGSVSFLPDGRARIRLERGADMGKAGESLAGILSARFSDHPPVNRLDWRTERPESEIIDPRETVEPDDVFDDMLAMDMEAVKEMADGGRLTAQEMADITAAERGAEHADRISKAFNAAAECITRMGL
jgi:hypothetical protein